MGKMKLSFVVELPDGLSSSGCNTDWVRQVSLLSSLGYEGVEISINNVGQMPLKSLEAILQKCHLGVSAIGTGRIYSVDNLSLCSIDNDIRSAAVGRLKQHIDLAQHLNTQVIIGLVRGQIKKCLEKEQQRNRVIGSLKKICDYAEVKKVILALEPINRYETSFFNTVEEVIAVIETIKSACLRVLLDTFHVNIEEKDFTFPFMRAADYISHIHFADSNRRCPGEGHINFKEVFSALEEIKYNKFISGEMITASNFDNCAKNYIQYMRQN